MDVLAYIRVSDPRQAAEDRVSLDVQRAALVELAQRLGRTISADGWFVEPGFSAGTADRPAFQRLLTYCDSHRLTDARGLVLVYKDDRWGRFDDPDESTYWRVHLRKFGWIVRFALSDDTDDPVARVVLRAIGAAQASQERQTIRARAKMGGRGTAAQGYWTNKSAFGFRRVAIDVATGATRTLQAGQRKGPNERLKLEPGPDEEVAFVRWLYHAYGVEGLSLAEITRQAPQRFPKPWIRRTLHQMLLNPVYGGDLVHGARSVDGNSEPIVVRDAHPALVSRETAAAVRAALARNRTEKRPTAGGYALSGLVHCATCGSPFVGGGGRRGPADDPERFRFYRDAGYLKAPPCPGRMMTFLRGDIEPQVIDAIAGVLEGLPVAEHIGAIFDRLLSVGAAGQNDGRAQLQRQRVAEQGKLDRLLAAIEDGTVTRTEAAERVAGIRRRLDELASSLERLRFDERRVGRMEAERDRLVALAVNFRAMAARLSGTELRDLLRPWLASALVDKDAMTLTLEIRPVPADICLHTSRPAGRRQDDVGPPASNHPAVDGSRGGARNDQNP